MTTIDVVSDPLAQQVMTLLRREMEEQQVSVHELSRRTGIVRPTLSRMLNCRNGSVRTDTILRCFQALDLDPEIVASSRQ